MLYIGLMSGTSMDAVDVALVEFDNKAKLNHYQQYPIDDSTRQSIKALDQTSPIADVARMDHTLGHLFADSINRLLKKTRLSASEITAIGSHGQTIFHHPDKDWQSSIQIGDPNIIAAKTGIKTVADFRRRDMAMGGQGAPLAPAFHQYQFGNENRNRTIVNIGGIANITNLTADNDTSVSGFDTGPGNGLLDDWNFRHNKTAFDRDSSWANSGTVIPSLLELLRQDPYFELPTPKSTGKDYFNLSWLETYLQEANDVNANDVQATLLELSMTTIAAAIQSSFPTCEEVFLCGGGANNPAMRNRLENLLANKKVETTAVLGIHPDAVEAVTFAWLAHCRINEIPIDFTSITGASEVLVPGAIYA